MAYGDYAEYTNTVEYAANTMMYRSLPPISIDMIALATELDEGEFFIHQHEQGTAPEHALTNWLEHIAEKGAEA